MNWTTRTLPHTDIKVGLCAWQLTMLASEHRDYVLNHPSPIVVNPSDPDALLEQAAPHLDDLPVLLGMPEPAFARQFEAAALQRMRLLGRERVEALVLHVEDPAEIKSGGLLQTMFGLRDRGVVDTLGLAHPDASTAEWLSMNAAVRLLGVSYSLEDQAARYRTLATAEDYGLSAFALSCPTSTQAIRFALAQPQRVLPVLDAPIPADMTPMTQGEADQAWQAYQKTHPAPPPLPRSRPPGGE